ncbi:MAG: hypothetical protein IPL25_19205 [Saprospiraceae bacterium]|nr:hypothetical protein [Candidatus Vicinibacter affinis]
MIYRVRPKTKGGVGFNDEVFGRWSTDNVQFTALKVVDFPHYFETVLVTAGTLVAHDEKKNWQHNVTYAEDGKRKDIITYFDGTLRSRQSVTINNSEKMAIASESFYDGIGRAAIHTLPVPTGKPAIKFYNGFSKNNAGFPYNKSDFLQNTSGCTSSANPMSSISGASKYYSDNNPIQNNWQDFVPVADGFPFVQTEYTPDLTGRVASQSMPGLNHVR